MDLLKAEIERKRKAVELAKSSDEVRRVGGGSRGGLKGHGGRYLKASDLRRFQERQEEKAERRWRRGGVEAGKPRKKRNRSYGENSSDDSDGDGGGRGKNGGVDDGSHPGDAAGDPSAGEEEGGSGDRKKSSQICDDEHSSKERDQRRDRDDSLKPSEVTRLLRVLGLPVRLFGERTVDLGRGRFDDEARLDRLHEARESRKAAAAGMSEMDEFRLGSGHGIRNPFLAKKRRGGDGEDIGNEDDAAQRARRDAEAVAGDRAETQSKRVKMSEKRGEGVSGKEDRNDEDDPHKRIYRFFKGLLRQWEDDLARRPEAAKRSTAGRNETKTLKQCKDYIRPLFKLCKKRTLEPGIMAHVTKIVDCCEKGEFVQAHDAYMDLSIGRAAWPMGVTMVGIHARSGREKISSSNVAHVMNSELQRKYLTSVKRLMSYYQKKRTDVDPSKKVLNN
mmetsp:Transcript_9764/g.29126  ORF Transcript_9764/g.29126 Transcript_9764/m.29126 type:complete len:447 (-) Transcript_9764:459-1799(-)